MKQKLLLVVVLVAIIGVIGYLESQKAPQGTFRAEDVNVDLSEGRIQDKAKIYKPAKEITTPDAFINAEPFALADLIGKKVILIDFWTYSCINCQRTTPYLNAWYDMYKDQGLEIVGIHTPEFEFEKELSNVQAAVDQFGIEFPVVLDNDFSTWQAYENRYWPHKYLIDIDGFIVYDHIGEGGYEETEAKIQELLAQRAIVLGEDVVMPSGPSNVTAIDVDFSQVNSPEVYFGSRRNALLANGEPSIAGTQTFTYPDTFKENQLYLQGVWNVNQEFATSVSPGAEWTFTFDAKNVYTVASGEGTVRVYLDGEDQGTIELNEETLYPLVELMDYGKHTLRVVVENGTVTIYTLTFG